MVLHGIVSKLEWLLGESAVDGLVQSYFLGSVFEVDRRQDGVVFSHNLADECMGGGDDDWESICWFGRWGLQRGCMGK